MDESSYFLGRSDFACAFCNKPPKKWNMCVVTKNKEKCFLLEKFALKQVFQLLKIIKYPKNKLFRQNFDFSQSY